MVKFKKTLYLKGLGIRVPQVKKGAVAEISMISVEAEGFEVLVFVDEALHQFDRQGFYTYCKLLKSGNNYARFV